MEKRRLDDIPESTKGFYVLVQSVQVDSTDVQEFLIEDAKGVA